MIVVGWLLCTDMNTGGRYNPKSDSWTATGPAAAVWQLSHSAVWTGSEMIVWGGMTVGPTI